jgi:hypothetical protein
MASALMKTLKRTMAGEYSRELSVKVFAGQCRLIELGLLQFIGLGISQTIRTPDCAAYFLKNSSNYGPRSRTIKHT